MIKIGKKNEQKYFALIGDISNSRSIPERAIVQEKILSLLEDWNYSFSRYNLIAPLSVKAGDEIHGLFSQPEHVLKLIITLRELLFPVHVCFGVGYGSLSTKLYADINHIDGKCFHNARAALELSQKEKSWVNFLGFSERNNSTLSTMFSLMHALRSGWTQKQNQYVQAMRNSHTQKDVADQFRVTKSVISESLKASHFSTIKKGEKRVLNILQEYQSLKTTTASVTEKRSDPVVL